MYKFPLSIPPGREIEVTQPFKSTALLEYYRSKGIYISFHDAVDVRLAGNPAKGIETYGLPFVCPFPRATLKKYVEADPVNGIGGSVQVEYIEPDGTSMVVGCIHLSGTERKESYNQGDTLGYIGNAGYVVPPPEIGTPFGGSHGHVTLSRKKFGEVNWTAIDPLLYLDVTNPFRSADTGYERDKFAFLWAIQRIKLAMRKLGINV